MEEIGALLGLAHPWQVAEECKDLKTLADFEKKLERTKKEKDKKKCGE